MLSRCSKFDQFSKFALGWRTASAYWQFLIREDRESVRQCIHLATLQVTDLPSLNRAVGRELHRLARELGFRQRNYKIGLNERGHRWEKLVVARGLLTSIRRTLGNNPN